MIALALAEMARIQLDQKAYRKALNLCKESLEFEDTAQTRIESAISGLYVNDPAEAAKQASLATQLDPQNALAWMIQGEALLRTRDYATAVMALAKALEIKRDAETVYALGMARLGNGDKDAAAQTFSQFLALTGDFGWSRVLVGRAYQEAALMPEARAQYQKALLLGPKTPNAHYFWALNLLKENAWSPTDEVYAHLREELRLNPRHFEANYMLGSLASTARNYKESDQYLHLASQVNPSSPETWVLLGLNARNRNANQAAETYFRRAIAIADKSEAKEHLEVRKAYFGLGRLLIASRRSREGQQLLNKARELENLALSEDQKKFAAGNGQAEEKNTGADAPYAPQSDLERRPYVSPTSTYAATRSHSKRAESAVRHLEVVLGSSFNDLATAEALQEKYDQALTHYREAAAWDARIPGLQRNIGLAAFFAGQPADAIKLLSKVVTQTPDDAHARSVLGMAYSATGNFTKAVQTINPIANEALRNPQLGFAWAKSLAETGNTIGAARALQEIEKANPNPGLDRLIQFGHLWQKLGNTGHAEECFRRVLLIDPENPEAKCALHLAGCP